MSYPQIEKIIAEKGGEVSVEGVRVAYRHEEAWGVPCTLDFFREEWKEFIEAGGPKKHKVHVFPQGVDNFVYRVLDMVKQVVNPPSAIILSSGPTGISLLWRMTMEKGKKYEMDRVA